MSQVKEISPILESLGYYKKEKIIADFETNFKVTHLISDEVIPGTQTGANNTKNIILSSDIRDIATLNSIDDFQKPSVSLQEPSYIERYNFVTQDDILLKGRVLQGTQAVYINDYKLR